MRCSCCGGLIGHRRASSRAQPATTGVSRFLPPGLTVGCGGASSCCTRRWTRNDARRGSPGLNWPPSSAAVPTSSPGSARRSSRPTLIWPCGSRSGSGDRQPISSIPRPGDSGARYGGPAPRPPVRPGLDERGDGRDVWGGVRRRPIILQRRTTERDGLMVIDREKLEAALPGYEIGGELGRGAFGVVVAGVHRQLGRAVAIKQLPQAFGADPAVRARFATEARVLASL